VGSGDGSGLGTCDGRPVGSGSGISEGA